jgi:hypothetical protein
MLAWTQIFRMRSLAVILLFIAASAIVARPCLAAEPAGWPVQYGPRDGVVLQRGASLWSSLYDLFFGDGWEITIHQYDDSQALPNYRTKVGSKRSFTFKVPRHSVSRNIVYGSGDKQQLPLRLYYSNGKAGDRSDKVGQGSGHRITAILRSDAVDHVDLLRRNPLLHVAYIDFDAVMTGDGRTGCRRQDEECLASLFRSGPAVARHCGYDVFSSGESHWTRSTGQRRPRIEYRIPPERSRGGPIPPPFDKGDLFVPRDLSNPDKMRAIFRIRTR